MTTIALPSGIGDCAWAYSKLKHAGRLSYEVADGWPYRTVPFLELLPEVAAATYGQFTYQEIIAFEQVQQIGNGTRWGDLAARGWDRCFLEPNRHLEMGRPLAKWLPDLPTDYHFPIHTQLAQRARADALLEHLPRPLTGISAASYRGSEAWKTWGYPEWARFLAMLQAEVGGTIVLLGGFWDDLTATLADDGYPCLVGKTDVGAAVECLKYLDHFVGFSSGLGMVNTILWGKTFLLWPDHQVELSRSWACPEMLETGTYDVSLWRDPEEVIERVRQWVKRPSPPGRREHQR